MNDDGRPVAVEAGQETLRITTSRGFAEWLADRNASLGISTYQLGRLMLIGTDAEGRLSVVERSFPRCMGLVVSPDGREMWMSSLNQMFRLTNPIPPGAWHEGHDAMYVPRMSWVTGNLDIHDIAIGGDGRPVFVNTRFNCLARLSDGSSFAEVWRPPFVSRLVAEDRCHLNGLATGDAGPRYVTAAGRSDVADGWRAGRIGGGVVIDVGSGEIVAEGLTMPHSPRLRDGRLWLLNSGEGVLGICDPARGTLEPVAFCPGFARGMAFLGSTVVVGLSQPRRGGNFDGLPLDEALAARGTEPACGLMFVEAETGAPVHWLRLEGAVRELYDVVVLPGVRRPTALSFHTDEINRVISVDTGRRAKG